jgi:hypothetical protein
MPGILALTVDVCAVVVVQDTELVLVQGTDCECLCIRPPPSLATPSLRCSLFQGGWGFLDLEKSDDEGEDEEASSEGFDPGSEAEDDDESSEDMSDEVRHEADGTSVTGGRTRLG